jgi:hypothetical protein
MASLCPETTQPTLIIFGNVSIMKVAIEEFYLGTDLPTIIAVLYELTADCSGRAV